MEKMLKRRIYIFLFSFLGTELNFLIFQILKGWHTALLVEDLQKYGFGFSWDWWLAAYGASGLLLLVLGALSGFSQGKYWWKIIYETRGGRGAKPERFFEKGSLIIENAFSKIRKKYFEVKNFEFGSGKIDDICVGPTGIFTIEIKEHKGILAYYDGHLLVEGRKMKEDFVGDAKKEAEFLSDLIFNKFGKKYFVVPMIIFPNADIDESMNFRKDEVWIGDAGFQNYVIKKSNYTISKEEVLEIVKFLKEEKAKFKKDEK